MYRKSHLTLTLQSTAILRMVFIHALKPLCIRAALVLPLADLIVPVIVVIVCEWAAIPKYKPICLNIMYTVEYQYTGT